MKKSKHYDEAAVYGWLGIKKMPPQADDAGEDSPVEFSPDYRQKIALLLEEKRREAQRNQPAQATSRKIWQKLSATALALLLIMTLSVGPKKLWAAIQRFVGIQVEDHGEYSDIRFSKVKSEISSGFQGLTLTLGYLPEGFKLDKEIHYPGDSYSFKTFIDENHNYIDVSASVDASDSIVLDTEGASVAQVFINGEECLCVQNKGWVYLMWKQKDTGLSIHTSLPLEEALTIAREIRFE